MKKLSLIVGLIVFISFSIYGVSVIAQTNPEVSQNEQEPKMKSEAKKVLVAYFSHTGNTRTLAEEIQKNTGGDIFEIKTVDKYPTEYNVVTDQAGNEQRADARPQLADKVVNIESYDLVFIGYPIWWDTMPMALFTFLEEYDLSGKTIIPFCTHEGSGLGKSVNDISKFTPKSTVLEGLAIRGSKADKSQKEVQKWLTDLGLAK